MTEPSMDRWRCVVATGAERTRYGEAPRYAEGLYDLGNGVYAWLVPNGSWGESNGGLVLGVGGSLLVDTQWDEPHTRQMLDAMERVAGGVPIGRVVNTHSDGDHFWGNRLVAAEAVTSRAAREEMRRTRPASLVLLGVLGGVLGAVPLRSARRVGHWFGGMVGPYRFRGIVDRRPERVFDGEAELEVGARMVRLVEVGPAHSAGDVVVHVPDARTVFAGDVVFVGSTPVMWAGPAARCIAALDRILALDADVVVPGHGPITDRDGVREVRAYWEFVERETRRRHDAGMSAAQAAQDIVRSDEFRATAFAGWDSPERMVINTHTEYRHFAGRTGHPGTLEVLDIMRKQALLAHELPDAEPQALRLPPGR